MTQEQFRKSWQEECLIEGVLTIPDCVTDLSDWQFCGSEEIRKVVLPANGVRISDYVFCDCVNLEEVENFPPTYHVDEEFIDEETGENVHIIDDLPCDVANSAFCGCYKLFKDRQRIDEEGCLWIDVKGKSYYIGTPDSTPSFSSEMSELISNKYIESGLVDKTAFRFQEKINRYGTDYEYLFENGALYNKTQGTWLLYLPDFCNKHIVIPEWVEEVNILNYNLENKCNDIKSLKFLGGTDLGFLYNVDSVFSFDGLESIEFSEKHTSIPASPYWKINGDFPNLITAKFGCPECKLEENVFQGSSSLQSLIGIEHNYTLYGGGIFHQGHLVSVLSDELHYPEGSEWLDNCWVSHVLYLPKSIKYIENNPNFKEDYDRGWEPTYLHVKTIVVPAGYKDYYLNLFWENLQAYEGWFEDIKREELSKHIVEN